MSDFATHGHGPGTSGGKIRDVEHILKDELARGDKALRGVPPVLTHLLASSGQAMVSDAIVARLRGMLEALAGQLLAGKGDQSPEGREIDQLCDSLAGDSIVLSYCYALAMEALLTERLEQRASLDPVLSPLMQELIASEDAATGELAMNALAAQSRFIQSQRRMDLPLSELPAELFHAVLKRWETQNRADPAIAPAVKALKLSYDEGSSRVGLLARLVSAMRGGAIAALDLEHAGLALFVSALSALSRQPRELAILACHERQAARLALSLRAAGLEPEAIERQFLLLDPAERLPTGIGSIDRNRAAELLSNANPQGAER
ncbi:hypothetical protein [Erythrobacter sp. THAF29]|uniref:hypothetical protein n=1 Tax=Erythrobacter sp. THAF29 TaxID=2587851 RepID=UPI00126955A8|nr:hypothetical protein [Erythrobacter sp. THAF29]QFT77977.1 hypothetical protein FIU90_10560 [Erythrobacter sp. THAF29]